VRVVGSGHSFSPLIETSGSLISLDALQGVLSVDAERLTATVRAGTKIHALGRPLLDAGVALKNQGDIDRQAIGGAVGTGTHGTGPTLGSHRSAS
jgi:L-gulono-1,4-lactone dehydrogenase